MKLAVFLGALTLASSASAMSVQAFLVKADALERKGPLALFSSDLNLLTNQVKADATALRAENDAAAAASRPAGRPKAYCTPAGGAKMTDKDIMVAMRAVPAANRATTDTRAALRSYMVARYPCRR